MGAGQSCPAPIQRGAVPIALRAREGLWVLSWCANTRARTRRERWGRGEPRGADSGGLGGAGGAGIPCWRAVPTRGRAKLTLLGRGRGALPAVVGFW